MFSFEFFFHELCHVAFDRLYVLRDDIHLIIIIIHNVDATDHLGHEHHLVGIRFDLEQSKQGVLDHADLARLLLVSVVDLLGSDLCESLRNDGDEQIQHDNDVEEAADEEDEPVALPIESEVFIELA